MNINNLFAHQKALDHKIIVKKGLQGKYLLKDKTVALICELYEFYNLTRVFKFWSTRREVEDRDELLEEFVDLIHFTLSIANDFGYHSHKYIETCGKDLNQLVLNITNIATVLPKSKEKHHIITLVNLVIQLGYELGFTEEEVIAAYFEKNKVNHERQASNY